MITDFIKTANGRSTEIELPEKVYNIMGDYPETIAEYVVPKIIKNEKMVKIIWLTNSRDFRRFMLARFNKRDYFNKDRLYL